MAKIDELTIYYPRHKIETHPFFATTAAALRERFGIEVKVGSDLPSTKVVICWGWKKGRILRALKKEVLVFERGYLGDRFHWTSIGWNGLNGYADFCMPQEPEPARFDENFSLKPWKSDGDKIIIMGQVKGDASLQKRDLTVFYANLAGRLRAEHGLPVYYKPHPCERPGRCFRPPNVDLYDGGLDDAMREAYLVAGFNSNALVDAVVNGVPAIALDRGAMAWEVCGHNEKERLFPVREPWAWRLAWTQWSPEEIAAGDYWPRLRQHLESL